MKNTAYFISSLCLCCVLFFNFQLLANSKEIQIQVDKIKTEKDFNTAFLILDKYVNENPQSVLLLSENFINKTTILNSNFYSAKAKLIKAKAFTALGENSKAILIVSEIYPILKNSNDTNTQAELNLLWSTLLLNSSKHDEALFKAQIANKLFSSLNNKVGAARALINIGSIYQKLNKNSESIKTNQAALLLLDNQNDKNYTARIYNNLANNYLNTGDLNKALDFLTKSLELKIEIGDKNSLAKTYTSLGNLHSQLGDTEKSIYYIKLAYQINNEQNDKNGMGIALISLGAIYYELQQYDVCEKYFLQALELFKEGKSLELEEVIHENLAEIYSIQKNHLKAYNHLSNALVLKDSIFGEQLSKNIAEMSAKFNVEKAEEKAEKEKIKREADNKTSKYIIFSIALLVLLISVIAIFLYKQSTLRKYANARLEIQKQQIEIKNHEIELKNKDITDSIKYAKHIQEAIVPPNEFIQKFLPQSFVLYLPKDIVAGDFYWVDDQVNENNDMLVYFAVVDCTGHGVPGAMMSVVGANGLYRCVDEFILKEPAAILDKLTAIVEDGFKRGGNVINDGMDISLGRLNLGNGNKNSYELSWSGANNPLWIIKKSGEFIEITADKQPIGKFEHRKAFTQHNLIVEKGDSLYLFTDGYADQFGGPKGKKMKYAKLKQLLLEVNGMDTEIQKNKIHTFFNDWRGDLEQVDDVCVMGIKI